MKKVLAVLILAGVGLYYGLQPSVPAGYEEFKARYGEFTTHLKENKNQIRYANYDDEAQKLYREWEAIKERINPRDKKAYSLWLDIGDVLEDLKKRTAIDRLKNPEAEQYRPLPPKT